MTGIPNVAALRTISLFGLSDVVVQFTFAFTHDEAQQWVVNRLSQMPPLSGGVVPQITRENPIGEIYRYRVVGPGYSLTDLKTIEDWIMERRLRALPGIIGITGWGGKTKTCGSRVDLDRLLAHGSPPQSAGTQQQQHQCRGPDGQFRAAGCHRSGRWVDPIDGSDT
jgi:cobalt-zinc-cadmium resistance protein CzcA